MITCRAPEKSCGVAYILSRLARGRRRWRALRVFGIKIPPIFLNSSLKCRICRGWCQKRWAVRVVFRRSTITWHGVTDIFAPLYPANKVMSISEWVFFFKSTSVRILKNKKTSNSAPISCFLRTAWFTDDSAPLIFLLSLMSRRQSSWTFEIILHHVCAQGCPFQSTRVKKKGECCCAALYRVKHIKWPRAVVCGYFPSSSTV